jgi:hypothetical protein
LIIEAKYGLVWIYSYSEAESSWEPVVCLHASDGSSSDKFGVSVAIDGTNILIGAELADGYDYNSGAVYAYSTIPAYVYYSEPLSLRTVAVSMLTVGAFAFSGLLVVWAYRSGALKSVIQQDCYFGSLGHNPDFDASRRGDVSDVPGTFLYIRMVFYMIFSVEKSLRKCYICVFYSLK